jgi:hypothetical protein
MKHGWRPPAFSRDKTSDKSDRRARLTGLSDDELDEQMVKAGLMEQDHLDQRRDSLLLLALAQLPGGPPEYHKTLAGLMKLRDEGAFPYEAQDLYDRLRTRAMADVETARKAVPKVTWSPADVAPDTSMAGWLKAHWTSADEAVRNALQAVARAVGASIPLSRTRDSSVDVKDPGSTQRTESTRHTSHAEQDPLEGPAEKEEPDYHDRPQWHDDDAEGWEPVESLRDAFRSDEDRGWF